MCLGEAFRRVGMEKARSLKVYGWSWLGETEDEHQLNGGHKWGCGDGGAQ